MGAVGGRVSWRNKKLYKIALLCCVYTEKESWLHADDNENAVEMISIFHPQLEEEAALSQTHGNKFERESSFDGDKQKSLHSSSCNGERLKIYRILME